MCLSFLVLDRPRIVNSSIKAVEMSFLCEHIILQARRLAPVRVKEVTRRVNLMGVWQVLDVRERMVGVCHKMIAKGFRAVSNQRLSRHPTQCGTIGLKVPS